MKDKIIVTSYVVMSILMATGVFAFLLYALGWWIGGMPEPTSEDSFFGYFSNSVGLAVAAAGTIFAIILAYTALKSSEIQTTTVALQEFRQEIDDFVSGANTLYDETVALFLLSAKMAANGYAVSSQRAEVSMGIDEAEKELAEAFDEFSENRVLFRQNVRRLHEILLGGGNIFLRRMVEENFKQCAPEIEALKGACKAHWPLHHDSVTHQIAKVTSPLATIELLLKFASEDCLGAFADVNHFDPPESNAGQTNQEVIAQFSEALRYGDIYDLADVNMFVALTSRYLPCAPYAEDYIDQSGEAAPEDPYARLAAKLKALPAPEALDFLRTHNKNGLFIYQHILPIYLKLMDPESGIAAMRAHFSAFGARKDILRLFIDSHAARLAYAHRIETGVLFGTRKAF